MPLAFIWYTALCTVSDLKPPPTILPIYTMVITVVLSLLGFCIEISLWVRVSCKLAPKTTSREIKSALCDYSLLLQQDTYPRHDVAISLHFMRPHAIYHSVCYLFNDCIIRSCDPPGSASSVCDRLKVAGRNYS